MYKRALVIREKSLKETKRGQKEVWTAKNGDEGIVKDWVKWGLLFTR